MAAKRGKSCLEGCESTDCVNSTQNACASAIQFDEVEKKKNILPRNADLSDESASDKSDDKLMLKMIVTKPPETLPGFLQTNSVPSITLYYFCDKLSGSFIQSHQD